LSGLLPLAEAMDDNTLFADPKAFVGTLKIATEEDTECASQFAAQVTQYLADLKPDAAETESSQELVQALLLAGAPEAMVLNLRKFPFERRRDVSKLTTQLISAGGPDGILHLQTTTMLDTCVCGYEAAAPDVALISGLTVRELCRDPAVAELLLRSPAFFSLFDHLLSPNFDVASDAFTTFKGLLTDPSNKQMAADVLSESFKQFFHEFHRVLKSDHFFSRLQLIKLLGELLFDRSNFKIMKNYISEPEHLKVTMQLLKDDSAKISCEALNVFKIFVANPDKAPGVRDILFKNKEKLLTFFETFEPEDGLLQFDAERDQVMDAIRKIE